MSQADVMERLLSKVAVNPTTGCWEFQGCRIAAGYGRISWSGRLWLTHRVTYTNLVGAIPDDLEIDHLCKNKTCCNPAHLEPVTRSENIRRGTQWIQAAERERSKTRCPAGHSYDDDNTYFTPRGHRQCRICKAAANEKYCNRPEIRERKRAASAAWRRKKEETAP